MRLSRLGDGVSSLQPASFGMSSMVAGGVFFPGERAIFPDDNNNHSPTLSVFGYSVPTPRTCSYALLQTGHVYVMSSVDAFPGSTGSLAGGSDDQHPQAFQFLTGNTSTGHLSFGSGNSVFCFHAASHVLMYEAMFMVPVLSTVTDQFVCRIGWTDVVTGAVGNGAYYELDSSVAAAGNLVTASASTRTTSSTGVSIVAGTYYRMRIVVTNATQVDLYIATEGSTFPSTPTVSITTNIPNGVGTPFATICLVNKLAGTTERGLVTVYYWIGAHRAGA